MVSGFGKFDQKIMQKATQSKQWRRCIEIVIISDVENSCCGTFETEELNQCQVLMYTLKKYLNVMFLSCDPQKLWIETQQDYIPGHKHGSLNITFKNMRNIEVLTQYESTI